MSTHFKRALIVLDPQRVYTSADSELFCEQNDETMRNINLLIDDFSKRRDPIILVRHIHARDGSDLGRMFDFAGPATDFNFKDGSAEVEFDPQLHRPQSAYELTKNRYSAFQGTALDQYLRENRVQHLVICGFMTNFCCDSTSRDAHDRDYYVTFLPDATGCPALPSLSQDEIRSTVGTLLEGGYAVIKSTDEYLKERG